MLGIKFCEEILLFLSIINFLLFNVGMDVVSTRSPVSQLKPQEFGGQRLAGAVFINLVVIANRWLGTQVTTVGPARLDKLGLGCLRLAGFELATKLD